MRQSHLFTKTRREAPKDEVAKNAQLLVRAGYIHKEMAGVYTFLPLGLRTFNRICTIIREEMDAIGGQELLMTVLQDRALWEATGRWDDAVVDNWFKTELKVGGMVGLGLSHEEPLTNIMKSAVSSYRDLPILAYQIQEKFRNEIRAKSGIMRGREFFMKDMYSFAASHEQHEELYQRVRAAYQRIFERVGLGAVTYGAFASGGIFSKYSEEFQTLSDAGEDTIYVDEEKKVALNKEVYTDDVLADLGLSKDRLVEKKAIETGNIFSLGTRFSDALSLTFTDEAGNTKPVVMGCYGLGPSRLMGTIVEVLGDEKGLVWPVDVSPYDVHLISLARNDDESKEAERLYQSIEQSNIAVLYDDRAEVRAGEKFADSELIGVPLRVIVSAKSNATTGYEVVERHSGKVTRVPADTLGVYISTRARK